MKQEFNINLSKLLFDLIAVNIALGITNLIIFYTFWVDGWSYPSLFIFINLSTIVSFYFTKQKLYNPSFNLKSILGFSLKYLLIAFLLVTIYWLIVLDRKYYLVHLGIFYSLSFVLVLLLRFVWIKIFRNILRRIYSTKNVMLVSKNYKDIAQSIIHNDWLKYSLEHSVGELNPKDISLYMKQYDLDILIIDLKENLSTIEDYKLAGKSENLKLFFLNPLNPKFYQLKKIIGKYKLYQL
ncbi:MAG: hypothetical protein JNL75_11605 [Chitinophagales bacterium]|nr:hypothetical protein [Chitinophagales bacterium]